MVQDLVVRVWVVLVLVAVLEAAVPEAVVPGAVVPVVVTIAVPVQMKSCHCAMSSVLATTSTSVQLSREWLLVVRV